MAPRKGRPARDKQAATLLAPNSMRVTKAKTALAEPTTTRRSSRLIEKPSTITVQRHKNGLLDLRRTPSHLVGTVKLNSTASPLLRLPPELRRKIWEFAMGVSDVWIFFNVTSQRLEGYAPRKTMVADWDWMSQHHYVKERRHKVLLAFHLPEVCRQLYAETAVLAYTLNTFIVDSHFLDYNTWASKLMPAQRNSIKYVVASQDFFSHHASDQHTLSLKHRAHGPLRNLCHIRIRRDARNQFLGDRSVAYLSNQDLTQDQTQEQWKAWTVRKLKEIEGEEVEVEFEADEQSAIVFD